MKSVTNRRLEWIYLAYLAFFVLAVMSPSFVRSDYFGVPQRNIEEVLIFVFGLAGLMTFSIYERLMERRLRERDEALGDAERAKKELVESYSYIGSVNRQIEVLKRLVNETSASLIDRDAYWKDVLQSLAANAAASVNASRVLVRWINLDLLRTEREILHRFEGSTAPLKVPNKELRKLHESGVSHAFIRTEDGEEVLVVPSDRKDTPVKVYFLFATDSSRTASVDTSLVKVFVNQAELVYHSMMRQKDTVSPLSQVQEVTSSVKGTVS